MTRRSTIAPLAAPTLAAGQLRPLQPVLPPRSVLRLRDLFTESTTALVARPARSALTMLGTVLGVGTLIAVLGLTATAAGQIGARFDVLTVTAVTVTDARPSDPGAAAVFPGDADARARALNGAEAAGVSWTVPTGDDRVRGTRTLDGAQPVSVPVIAASAGLWDAVQPHLAAGRVYDGFADERGLDVVVLGASVAHQLGVSTLAVQPAIYIGDTPYLVAGIVDDVVRRPDLLLSVVVPRTTAEARWGPATPDDEATMLVTTQVGAATQVAGELPLALLPAATGDISVVPPPDPRALRDDVDLDLAQLFYALAGLCLFIGSVGIANATLVAVMERTGEIGLRRALGARPRHIALHVVTESAALGVLGSLIGGSVGVLTVVAVAVSKDWTPILNPVLLLAAPLIGLATGALAGLYPATRAARIEPTEALRR